MKDDLMGQLGMPGKMINVGMDVGCQDDHTI